MGESKGRQYCIPRIVKFNIQLGYTKPRQKVLRLAATLRPLNGQAVE